MSFDKEFKLKFKSFQKSIAGIFNSISLNLFDTGSFILGITFHDLKYLDKPIKCLEIRAKMKSVQKFNQLIN